MIKNRISITRNTEKNIFSSLYRGGRSHRESLEELEKAEESVNVLALLVFVLTSLLVSLPFSSLAYAHGCHYLTSES